MPPRRRRRRRTRILPAAIAVVVGLAVATGIFWQQNPGVELKVPEGIASQATRQGSQRDPVPESFAAITATKTPRPPTRWAPTVQPEETNDSRSVLEEVSRTLYEPKEERQARQVAEATAMVVELERKVHDGINGERAIKRGSSQLRWDDRLKAIARAHSEDMTERGYFSHDTPEGLGPTERGTRAGYSCWKGSHYGLAENITIELMSNDTDKLAAAAVQGWVESPGHRANLLDRQYDRTGIGASFGKWRGYKAVYLTQVFC